MLATNSHPVSLLDRDAADLRETILKAAISLFLEQGIQQTRIGEIAKASDTSRPNIYRYFPGGKFDIVNAMELVIVHRFYTNLAARIPLRGDPALVLSRFVVASVQEAPTDTYAALLVRSDIAKWTSRFVAESDEMHELMVEIFDPILRFADSRQRLVQGLDRGKAIRWLSLVMNACITMPEIVRNPDDLRHYVDHHIVPTIVRPKPGRA